MAQEGQTTERTGRVPFDAGERKKIAILIVLGVVCAAVLVPQVWKSRGPAVASAAVALAGEGGLDLEGVVTEIRAGLDIPVETGRQTVFATVDEALELFLGGAKPAVIPAEDLPASVFGLRRDPNGAGDEATADASAPGTGDTATAAQTDPVLGQLAALNLETVLVSARNRAAIINGQVLHTGEIINGFEVRSIDPGCVALSRDGKQFALTLN